MLHETDKLNLPRALERTRAAVGVLADFGGVLHSIRKGMPKSTERLRIEEMIRMNRETLAALERKLTAIELALEAGST